jgi:UDP-N-acetylmuramoylalanine--D-glutamate ligase
MEVGGKRVLVVGLARSGREVARCLVARGATVTVSDSKPPSAFQAEIRELAARKVGLELGGHREESFLKQDLIVVSPGVPWDMPYLVKARERGIPVVPEIEAASWYLQGPIVGITGSNGKTTTTSLLGKMIKSSGFSTFVGGNIGTPLSSAVDKTSRDTVLVTELSSFQLEAIQTFRPHVAVLLNLTPNHLDRHPSFEAYVNAKAQIFRNQTEKDFAVLNADDPVVMRLAPAIRSRKVFFSRRRSLPDGVFVSDGRVLYRVANLERELLETRQVPLRGAFNLENVLAAATAACLMGADFNALRSAVGEFQGVEHRLEFVRTVRGVEFYNDSKATSVDATAKALSAFERGVHLILGGKDKGAPYAPLRPLLQGRVRDILLIGAASHRIEQELGDVAVTLRAGDLETAVQQAFARAVPGEVVLLAPACSSYDQFEDYEHRGRVFKKLTSELARSVESGVGLLLPEIRVPPPAPSLAAAPPAAVPPRDFSSAPFTATAEAAAAPEEPASPSAGSVAEATPPPVAAAPVSTPSGPVVEPGARSSAKAPHELTYVFEVGADEHPISEVEPCIDETDEAAKPLDREELGPVEEVADEALIFEVSAGAEPSGASGSDLDAGTESPDGGKQAARPPARNGTEER